MPAATQPVWLQPLGKPHRPIPHANHTEAHLYPDRSVFPPGSVEQAGKYGSFGFRYRCAPISIRCTDAQYYKAGQPIPSIRHRNTNRNSVIRGFGWYLQEFEETVVRNGCFLRPGSGPGTVNRTLKIAWRHPCDLPKGLSKSRGG